MGIIHIQSAQRFRIQGGKVTFREFGDSGIMLRANMWTRTTSENFEACSDARLAIKKAFDEKGIEIPYNKVVVLKQNY